MTPVPPAGQRRRLIIGVTVGALLLAASVPGYYYGDLARRRRRNRKILVEVAAQLGMRPELLLAVAETESGFDDRARSNKGAIGLMQVMPPTAREVAGRMKLKTWHLHEARDNALIGGTYLKGLIARYRGDLHLALAAYHAGPGRVKAWTRKGPGLSGRQVVSRYGFKITRRYVARVLERTEKHSE
jgi:peptidoglycan lytic transglycosylase